MILASRCSFLLVAVKLRLFVADVDDVTKIGSRFFRFDAEQDVVTGHILRRDYFGLPLHIFVGRGNGDGSDIQDFVDAVDDKRGAAVWLTLVNKPNRKEAKSQVLRMLFPHIEQALNSDEDQSQEAYADTRPP